MVKKNQNEIYVNDYNRYRKLLEYFYVYGCYSRDDYGKMDMSARKYDEDFRKLKKIIDSNYINEEINYKRKYISLNHDYYKDVENYLVNTYLCRSFTNKNLTLFFLIQQVLKENGDKMDFQGICVEVEQYLENDSGLESSISRQLREMVEHGVINRCFKNKKALYFIEKNFFNELTYEELFDLYESVQFFCNINYPSVPGYYLKDTVEKYILLNKKKDVTKKGTFLYRFNNIHVILHEEIVWPLLTAIDKSLEVEIKYKNKKKNNLNSIKLKPVKVICDVKYGRWFLIAKSNFEKLSVYKIENIIKVKILKSKFQKQDYIKQYTKEYSKSWTISGLRDETQKIRIKFDVESYEERNFLIDKVRRETKHGKIEVIDDRSFIYIIEVNDLRELKPWIRSFSHRAEVIDCSDGAFKEELNREWEGLLKKYESICEAKE